MNAEEKREMYMAFIKKVFSYSTLKTKMAAIISEAAEQAVELPEKVKKKREKDLKFAIQRQIALQVSYRCNRYKCNEFVCLFLCKMFA